MNQEQLEALIEFIKAQAYYETRMAVNGSASWRERDDAEDTLRQAFEQKEGA